jgi:hypothetical protein
MGSLGPAEAGRALATFRQDLAQQYRIVEITIPLLQEASRLANSHVLRAYDSVQLAAALEIHAADPSLTLVSADAELNAAARVEGLTVDDPNSHPQSSPHIYILLFAISENPGHFLLVLLDLLPMLEGFFPRAAVAGL